MQHTRYSSEVNKFMFWNDEPVFLCGTDLSSLVQLSKREKRRGTPQVVTTPFRKIPCSEIADDFYSNLIDWSESTIYYSVNDSVFAYNFFTGRIEVLFHSPNASITSLRHCAVRDTLCVGTGTGSINFIDLCSLKHTKYHHHRGRIGTIEVFDDNLVTGSRDRRSKLIDLRTCSTVSTFSAHLQEVCGLSVNRNRKYLASGGNDNKIFVYDFRNCSGPVHKFSEHLAAVRALSWSPISSHQLITGGGTADKTIKRWDVSKEGHLVSSHNFESQVCNLKWLKNNKVLCTFGYSNDDIKLLEEFRPVKVFSGHKNRVIHFSVDATEKYFVSGSSDSKIRVWEIEKSDECNDIKLR